jgi:cell division protein ZapA (FtsZ GTPase activity inhibitor)
VKELDKRLFKVQVAGLTLKLKSSHDEETVKELASLVDKKINEALENGKNVSFQNALLLASLHLAEDLILLRQMANQKLTNLEVKTLDILSDLEDSPISRIRLDN